MVKHKSIIHILAMVAIVCFDRPLPAVEFEMKGIMQYDVSESAIPAWLNLIGNWGLFRFSLHKVWERRIGVDVDVAISNVKGGSVRIVNLKHKQKIDLPPGRYYVKCDKFDLSIVSVLGERLFCINREGVLTTGYRNYEVLFYPKGSAITVKGRFVDEDKRPVVNVEVYGDPDNQSDAYFYDENRLDGSRMNKVLTNENGEFVFENQPPAAVELGVYYLLTGEMTKPMQGEGEVAFNFSLRVPDYYSISRGIKQGKYQVPLISAANLPALRKVAEKLRSAMPEEARQQLDKMRKDPIVLPVSTNNVIYVGDIVVYKDKEK